MLLFARRGAVAALGGAFAGALVLHADHERTRTRCSAPVEPELLYRPKRPYPEWDPDWDAKRDASPDANAEGRGPTRHLILVRHGQYDETFRDDKLRVLTPLGRQQAEATGERLRCILERTNGPVRLHVSSMARAAETANIIAKYLPSPRTKIMPADPGLAEGYPAQPIPFKSSSASKVERDSARIEGAFQSLFYRGKPRPGADPSDGSHEWDVVVCHANVIRFFALRALQLPPEAWLRLATFNCSITYVVIRPNGNVSMRMLGDVGHMSMEQVTFSMHEGFEW